MAETALPCPICLDTENSEVESWTDPVAKKSYRVMRCAACTAAFADPFVFPGGAWYEKYNYLGGTGEAEFGWTDFRVKFLFGVLPIRAGRLLDIGCGAGHLLKRAARIGLVADGLEVDRRLVRDAREKTRGKVYEGVFDENFAKFHAGRYDVVSLFDVLEHLDEPHSAIDRVRRLLRPGGYALISVPNDSRVLPHGRDAWDYPPHHLLRFTAEALSRLLLANGFELVVLDAGSMTVFGFSRHAADRAAQALLRMYKRVFYGPGADQEPMDSLKEKDGQAPDLTAKSRRQRWVARFHNAFHYATFPYFLMVMLYYRWKHPHGGMSLLVLAKRRP